MGDRRCCFCENIDGPTVDLYRDEKNPGVASPYCMNCVRELISQGDRCEKVSEVLLRSATLATKMLTQKGEELSALRARLEMYEAATVVAFGRDGECSASKLTGILRFDGEWAFDPPHEPIMTGLTRDAAIQKAYELSREGAALDRSQASTTEEGRARK
jgi:hypothetical protein